MTPQNKTGCTRSNTVAHLERAERVVRITSKLCNILFDLILPLDLDSEHNSYGIHYSVNVTF